MADDKKSSTAEDVEEDPFNEEDLVHLLTSPNRTLMDLSFIGDPPAPNNSEVTQELAVPPVPDCDANNNQSGFLDDNDDFTLSWDMFETPSDDINDDNLLGETGGGGNGNHVGETYRLEVSTRVFGENATNFETGGSSTMPVPITPTITDGIWICTCCNLLRRLVHSNGREMLRLEIYGGIGFFCHAILETIRIGAPTSHQTIFLNDLGMERVKKYIEEYCLARAAEGFGMIGDTNASFYRAMNAGSNPNQFTMPPVTLAMPNLALNDIPRSLVLPNQTSNVPREEDQPPKEKKRRQTALAAQRARTGKMSLKDLGMYFRLPIEETARRMHVCPTVVKKICRRGGLLRWPHRKIKSLEKKIAALTSVLKFAKDARVRAQTEEQIQRLRDEINEICAEALRNLDQ